MPTTSAPPSTRLEPRIRRALDQAIDHVRRFAETQRPTSTRTTIAPGIEIERRWTPLDQRRRLRPRRLGAVPVVAGHDRRPGTGRGRRAGRRRLAGRPRRRARTRSCSAPPACSRSTPSSSPAAPRRSARSRTACPDAGIAPVDRIVGPGNAWVTAAKIEVCGEVGIDLPAGPSEGHGPRRAAGRSRPRRGRPHHPGRARPGLPGDPRHDGRRLRRRRRGRRRAPARDAPRAATSSPPRCATTAGSSSPRRSTPRSTSSTPTPRSTSRSTSSRSSRRSPACATPARCSSARGRPNPPATTRPAPTTSCRPAAWPARRAACRSRRTASSSRSSASTATGLASIRATIGDAGRGRGPARPSRRRRDPLRGPDPMSPTPVTFTSPNAPVVVQLGGDRRGGRGPLRPRPRDDRPVRPQHLPHPAGPRRPSCWRPAGSRRRCPNTRRPTTAAWSRRPPPATASTPAEILVGAGADEILDIVAKVFIPAGGARRRPGPDLRDVPRPDRAARRDRRRRPAARRGGGLGARPRRPSARPPPTRCRRRLAVQPEQPDRAGRARRRDRDAARRAWPTTPPRPGARPRSSSSTRPTPSSSGTSLLGLRDDYPNLIVVRTASKAYALAGLRVGFAVARPELIARLNPYRPPGSVSTVSVTLVTEALLDPTILEANLARVARERDPPDRRAPRDRLVGRAVGHELHPGRLRDRRSAPRRVAEALLSRGLVPRTFGAGHPLADHLRLTVRDPDENDRLIAAADDAQHGDHAHDHAARRHRDRSARGPPRDGRPDDATRPRSPSRSGSTAPATPAIDTGHRLLRPPARLARPPRPVRPGDPRRRRPPGRRAPHRRGRRPRARRRVRRGARRPGRDRPVRPELACRWTNRSPRPSSTSAAGRTPSSTCRSAASARAACRSSSSSTRSSRSRGPPGATLHLTRHRPQRPPPRRGRVQGARPRAARRLRDRPAARGRRLDQGRARSDDARPAADRRRRLRRRQPRQHRPGADRPSAPTVTIARDARGPARRGRADRPRRRRRRTGDGPPRRGTA